MNRERLGIVTVGSVVSDYKTGYQYIFNLVPNSSGVLVPSDKYQYSSDFLIPNKLFFVSSDNKIYYSRIDTISTSDLSTNKSVIPIQEYRVYKVISSLTNVTNYVNFYKGEEYFGNFYTINSEDTGNVRCYPYRNNFFLSVHILNMKYAASNSGGEFQFIGVYNNAIKTYEFGEPVSNIQNISFIPSSLAFSLSNGSSISSIVMHYDVFSVDLDMNYKGGGVDGSVTTFGGGQVSFWDSYKCNFLNPGIYGTSKATFFNTISSSSYRIYYSTSAGQSSINSYLSLSFTPNQYTAILYYKDGNNYVYVSSNGSAYWDLVVVDNGKSYTYLRTYIPASNPYFNFLGLNDLKPQVLPVIEFDRVLYLPIFWKQFDTNYSNIEYKMIYIKVNQLGNSGNFELFEEDIEVLNKFQGGELYDANGNSGKFIIKNLLSFWNSDYFFSQGYLGKKDVKLGNCNIWRLQFFNSSNFANADNLDPNSSNFDKEISKDFGSYLSLAYNYDMVRSVILPFEDGSSSNVSIIYRVNDIDYKANGGLGEFVSSSFTGLTISTFLAGGQVNLIFPPIDYPIDNRLVWVSTTKSYTFYNNNKVCISKNPNGTIFIGARPGRIDISVSDLFEFRSISDIIKFNDRVCYVRGNEIYICYANSEIISDILGFSSKILEVQVSNNIMYVFTENEIYAVFYNQEAYVKQEISSFQIYNNGNSNYYASIVVGDKVYFITNDYQIAVIDKVYVSKLKNIVIDKIYNRNDIFVNLTFDNERQELIISFKKKDFSRDEITLRNNFYLLSDICSYSINISQGYIINRTKFMDNSSEGFFVIGRNSILVPQVAVKYTSSSQNYLSYGVAINIVEDITSKKIMTKGILTVETISSYTSSVEFVDLQENRTYSTNTPIVYTEDINTYNIDFVCINVKPFVRKTLFFDLSGISTLKSVVAFKFYYTFREKWY